MNTVWPDVMNETRDPDRRAAASPERCCGMRATASQELDEVDRLSRRLDKVKSRLRESGANRCCAWTNNP